MEYSIIIDRLSCIGDIYSFITELFLLLNSTDMSKHNSEYAEFCKKRTAELHKIRTIMNLLPCVGNADFDVWKTQWIDVLEDNKDFCKMICYQTLMNFDLLLPDLLAQKRGVLIDNGPLNQYSQQDALFYVTGPVSFFDKYFKDNKIRRGRQIVEHDATGLNRYFKNFFIIRKSSTNDYIPTIQRYNSKVVLNEEIVVGCCPMINTPWFTAHTNQVDDTLKIQYNDNDMKDHNNRIIKIIEFFDQQKVDIVTFPELALNCASLNEIKRFLLTHELMHIKYVFTGSVWNDRRNEAYVLSKDGTVLMKYQKKKPYQMFNKIKGVYVTEDILSDAFLRFIDIPGIGRVSYNICYDYNNDDVESVCSSVMKANFMFLAVYSNDTHLMEARATTNASIRGITTILTNSCAVADENNLISYMVRPVVVNKHLESKPIISFRKGEPCGDCESCVKTGIITVRDIAKPET